MPIKASDKRYLSKLSSMSTKVCCNLASYHSIATLDDSGWAISATSHPLISLKAFQILLANPFPWLHNSSSNKMSFPAEALNNNPTRTPSAPNFSINPNGSGEFPSDLDILRPCLSRTNPVK